jgi:hypothetical protein
VLAGKCCSGGRGDDADDGDEAEGDARLAAEGAVVEVVDTAGGAVLVAGAAAAVEEAAAEGEGNGALFIVHCCAQRLCSLPSRGVGLDGGDGWDGV